MHIGFKKAKIGFGITTCFTKQHEYNVLQWASVIPRVMSMGKLTPRKGGVRSLSASDEVPFSNLILSSLPEVPAGDFCLIGSPSLKIKSDSFPSILQTADTMGNSWAAVDDGVFIVTTHVLEHAANDAPSSVTIGGPWSLWLADWLQKHMPKHRIFTASIVKNEPRPAEEKPAMVEAEIRNAYTGKVLRRKKSK